MVEEIGQLQAVALADLAANLSLNDKVRIASALKVTFASLQKVQMPGIEDRCKQFLAQIDKLPEGLELIVDEERGRLIVEAKGAARDTLYSLARGTSWFVGAGDQINEVIVTALLGS